MDTRGRTLRAGLLMLVSLVLLLAREGKPVAQTASLAVYVIRPITSVMIGRIT